MTTTEIIPSDAATTDAAPTDATRTGAVPMDRIAAVESGGGDHRFFLNHLASVKVEAGSSTSQMSVVEFTAPRGFGPPLHVHSEEDEIMYVLDGEIRLDLGDVTEVVSGGAVVSLPHGIPHVFQVISEQARFLTVTSGGGEHPTFDEFVRTLGAPTDPERLPAPVEIDPGRVARVAAEHGIEILGPPPAPLDD